MVLWSEEILFKNFDFRLWGNHATTHKNIEILHYFYIFGVCRTKSNMKTGVQTSKSIVNVAVNEEFL